MICEIIFDSKSSKTTYEELIDKIKINKNNKESRKCVQFNCLTDSRGKKVYPVGASVMKCDNATSTIFESPI